MRLRTKVGLAGSALLALPLGGMAVPAGASAIAGDSNSVDECAVERLPLPADFDEAKVIAGDSSGRYLVGRTFGESDNSVLLWNDGEVTELPELPPYVQDVNGSGQVAGFTFDDEYVYDAWRYTDGEYSVLPKPEGIQSALAQGIDADGNVVGYGRTPEWLEVPLYWPADEPGTVRVLPDGDNPDDGSAGSDISDEGVVIGRGGGYTTGYNGGYLWTDAGSEPRKLLGSDGDHHAEPNHISGNGQWAAGFDSTLRPDGGQRGALWNLGTDEITVHEKPLSMVNSEGDATYRNPWPAVILHADGTMAKLPGLADSRPRFARVLPDRGGEFTAAGYARDDQNRWQPVVWRGC